MAKQTREALGVQPGDQIVVKGKVAFARLDKLVEGDALAKENERRASKGMLTTKAFRSVTIEDPEVVQGQGTALANFYGQTVYTAQNGKPSMNIESKSLYAPSYGHMQEDGTILEIADPMKNPAQGQVIYIVIKAYKPKGYNNLGSTFEAIAFEKGEIKFYEGGSGAALSGFGKQVVPLSEQQGTQQAPVQQAPAQQAAPEQSGFGQAPVQQPAQPQANPFGGFGVSDNQAQNTQGSPFGTPGAPAANPFA